jgi:hypothetical protein
MAKPACIKKTMDPFSYNSQLTIHPTQRFELPQESQPNIEHPIVAYLIGRAMRCCSIADNDMTHSGGTQRLYHATV